LRIPEVNISEDKAQHVAHALRNDINRVLSLLRDVALGQDLKKFLMVGSYYFVVSKGYLNSSLTNILSFYLNGSEWT
jgi:Reticulon